MEEIKESTSTAKYGASSEKVKCFFLKYGVNGL